MSLIPEITLTELKNLGVKGIKELGSCEITADGEYLGTLVVPQGESMIRSYCRERVAQTAFQNNSVKPKK